MLKLLDQSLRIGTALFESGRFRTWLVHGTRPSLTKADAAKHLAASSVQIATFHTTSNVPGRNKVPFEYEKPVRIRAIFKSGDKEDYKFDKTTISSKFRGSKELEDADENVRKMCSLEFATTAEVRSEMRREYIERVARHQLDFGSLESKIARLTESIRALHNHVKKCPSTIILMLPDKGIWQPRMQQHGIYPGRNGSKPFQSYPGSSRVGCTARLKNCIGETIVPVLTRHVKGRVMLKHAIDRRNKYYKYLRQYDYDRFEFVLEQLNLEYTRPARFYWYQTRKGYIRDMVQKYCDDTRVAKLQAIKDEFQSQQQAFLKDKAEKMAFIAREEIELGLRSPDDTVTQSIDEFDWTSPKPPPVESTLLRVARTAEGKVVYSVPTWPPRPEYYDGV